MTKAAFPPPEWLWQARTFAGHGSQALLLGLFRVSFPDDIVHLLFGAAGAASGTHSAAKNFLTWGGVICPVLSLYGLLVGYGSPARVVQVHTANDRPHLFLRSGMLAPGPALGRGRQGPDPKDPTWSIGYPVEHSPSTPRLLLLAAHLAERGLNAELSALGLSQSGLAFFEALAAAGTTSQQQLTEEVSAALGLQRQSTDQMLRRLVSRGYAERTPQGRRYQVSITDSGRNALNQGQRIEHRILFPVGEEPLRKELAMLIPSIDGYQKPTERKPDMTAGGRHHTESRKKGKQPQTQGGAARRHRQHPNWTYRALTTTPTRKPAATPGTRLRVRSAVLPVQRHHSWPRPATSSPASLAKPR